MYFSVQTRGDPRVFFLSGSRGYPALMTSTRLTALRYPLDPWVHGYRRPRPRPFHRHSSSFPVGPSGAGEVEPSFRTFPSSIPSLEARLTGGTPKVVPVLHESDEDFSRPFVLPI